MQQKFSNGNSIYGEIVDGTCGSLAGAFLFMSFINKLSDGAAPTKAEKEVNTEDKNTEINRVYLVCNFLH